VEHFTALLNVLAGSLDAVNFVDHKAGTDPGICGWTGREDMTDRRLVAIDSNPNADASEVLLLVWRHNSGRRKGLNHRPYKEHPSAQEEDLEGVLKIGHKGALALSCIVLESPS
jgi:hypothetical protein